jgi:uncharacterized membrane protein YedE/YeeE
MTNDRMSNYREKLSHIVAAGAVGLIFGVGLVISGMTQPGKVIGFLDLTGNWNPALAFVMGGALLISTFTYPLIRRLEHPLLDAHWHVPTSRRITPRLVLGSLMFGAGWGLAGYCPGPAITSLATFTTKPAVFVLAMLAGMAAYHAIEKFFGHRWPGPK